MAINMQGNWTLRVKGRNAAFAQRFVVSGAITGNGTYDGVVGNAVFVTGAQWTVNVQHRPAGRAWQDSAQRLGLPGVMGGLLQFDIAANDGGLDDDYDDLVLGCSLPASQSDYVVYGAVKTYSGACLFNPGRDDYIVIDSARHLDAVRARHPQLADLIEKLYPARAGHASDVTPLLLPTGLPNVAVGLLFQSEPARVPEPEVTATIGEDMNANAARLDQIEARAVSALRTTIKRVPFKPLPLRAGVSRLAHIDLETIAKIRDAAIRFRCQMESAPCLQLRFQDYARTATERGGGPYTGTGLREDLGMAITDELGNYIFRFHRAAKEAVHLPATSQRPDVIVQVLGAGFTLKFETAPYDNIANLRRVDLCVPRVQVHADQGAESERANAEVSDVANLRATLHAVDSTAQPDLVLRQRAVFEHVGATALMVVGPATGRCYRFDRPGAKLTVDLRDRPTLASIGSLRMQQAA
jgi:hypothetical protein